MKRASELIDMSKHEGAHPRMGATDVCPFIPVSNISMEKCIEIAKKTGKSRSYITNIVRILGLSTKVRKHLEDGIISFGHARALLGAEKQDELVDIVVNNSLNVRSTEDLIKEKSLTNIKIGNKKNLHSDRRDPNILDYEKYLSLKLGYKVEIKDKSGKGHILVKYKTLDQLEAIIEIFNK